MDIINYSQNWNNKLFCNCWSTIRIDQPDRFVLDKVFSHVLRDKEDRELFQKQGKLVYVKLMLLANINEATARLDSGLSAEKCKAMISIMYKNKNINWETQLLAFLVFTNKF